MTARVTELAAVSAVAVVLTLVLAAPTLRAPSERIFGRETVGRQHDPFTVMAQLERGGASRVYSQPATDVPGRLLARLVGPVAAYNGLVLLTFPLAAVAAYALGRHLLLPPPAAALAALAFAFSPFHLAHAAYHPHVAQTQWVALYLLALWRCLDDAAPGALAVLAAAALGVGLSNFYGGLIAAVLTPVALGAYWVFLSRREPGSTRRLVRTVATLAALTPVTLAYVWHFAPAVVADRSAFAVVREDLFRYSARWWSYLVPPVASPVLGPLAERAWTAAGVSEGRLEQQVSLGWGVVALGLVAAGAWLVQGPRAGPLAAVPVLGTIAVAALVCSLSPERAIGAFTFTRPSAVLYAVFPMFRAYARFGVVVQLMAALLAGVGAELLWRRRTRVARVACAAAVILVAGEYAVPPSALSRDILPTTAHRWAMRQGEGIRVLDCVRPDPESASVPWLSGGRIALRTDAVDDCTEPNLADKLAALGRTHLLIRTGTPEGHWFASRPTPSGLRPAARFHDAEVFQVLAAPPAVYTAQMAGFHAREGDEEWTWRWMEPEASWRVVNTRPRTVVAAVDIEMTAFRGPRALSLLLDGVEVQRLSVEDGRLTHRSGPWPLSPGDHELVFRSLGPATVADEVLGNGDRRRLTFGLGNWQWAVGEERP
jgi:hypothetical protein